MSQIEKIKEQLENDLQKSCSHNYVDFESMLKLIEVEKIKKLRKGNHLIQQIIEIEIEKSLKK